MTTRHHRSQRLIVAGVFAAAGLALSGCQSDGIDPENITESDVAEITESEAAETTESAPVESSPASTPTTSSTPTASGMPSMTPGAMGYEGAYDQAFYDGIDAYTGQEVTLSAEVTANLSGDSFLIGGTDGGVVEPLLVIEEEEVPGMNEGDAVQVTGTVQENFEVIAAEELLGIELDDVLYEDYVGEPYVSITSGEVLDEN